ncbi:MAG: hypothetical protein GY711_29755 [bacterium]|nr:hypothetical protein [bacterium]
MSTLLLLSLLALPLQTESAVQDQDGAATMSASRAELGDLAKIAAIKNVQYDGVAAWKGMSGKGRVREIYAGLEQAKVRSEFQGFGVFLYGTDGEVVWEKTPAGVVVRRGWDAAEFTRRFGWAQNLDWRQLYTSAKLLGPESLDGNNCIKLELVPRLFDQRDEEAKKAEPARDTLYLDEKTLLPRRLDAQAVGLDGAATQIQTSFSDWREVAGVKYAFHREVTVSGFTLIIDFEKIQQNVELAEAYFSLDDDVRLAVDTAQTGKPKPADSEPKFETLEERHLASIRLQCKKHEMQKTLSVALPEVFTYLNSVGAVAAGVPLVRYHAFGDEVDLEAAIPVAAPIQPKGRIKADKLPAGRAVVIWHVGPYVKLGATHKRMMEFLKKEGLEADGPPWEEYWTDPGLEPDPEKWRTKVVQPVKGK